MVSSRAVSAFASLVLNFWMARRLSGDDRYWSGSGMAMRERPLGDLVVDQQKGVDDQVGRPQGLAGVEHRRETCHALHGEDVGLVARPSPPGIRGRVLRLQRLEFGQRELERVRLGELIGIAGNGLVDALGFRAECLRHVGVEHDPFTANLIDVRPDDFDRRHNLTCHIRSLFEVASCDLKQWPPTSRRDSTGSAAFKLPKRLAGSGSHAQTRVRLKQSSAGCDQRTWAPRRWRRHGGPRGTARRLRTARG